MKNRIETMLVVVSICALALLAIGGCSSGQQGSSGSSGSAEASSASSAETQAASSEAGATAEAPSSEAASAEAPSADAAASEASSAEAAASEASSTEAAASDAAALSEASAAATNAGQESGETASAEQQTWTGTVHVLDANELLKLQKSDLDPGMFENSGTFAVLVFDEPTAVTGMVADGTGPDTRTASMVGIAEYSDYGDFTVEYGDIDLWKQYDGQKVSIAATTDNIVFPTDVRLPINEPQAKNIQLVD